MFKSIISALKGIAAVIVVIIVIALIVIIGPFIMLVCGIAVALFIGYIVYYINKEAPDLMKDLKEELAKS